MMTVRFHQTVFLHARKVLGHLGLGASKNILNVADAKGPLLHQIENAEPGLVTKALVNLNKLHLLLNIVI